jgi:hypothetical protein
MGKAFSGLKPSVDVQPLRYYWMESVKEGGAILLAQPLVILYKKV